MKLNPKINVAIDGPAGSGKTTIGKLLAQKLNYQFLDSGLLFRHFAWFCQKNNLSVVAASDQKNLLGWQKEIEKGAELIADLEKKREILGSSEISELASQLSPLPELRKIILDFQRKSTHNKGWVVVGRDITSTVLPHAEIKIFLTASLAERIKRRHRQLSGEELEKIKQELQIRDERDQQRKLSPLQKTSDSWELDTTHLSPSESVEKILTYLAQKINLRQ